MWILLGGIFSLIAFVTLRVWSKRLSCQSYWKGFDEGFDSGYAEGIARMIRLSPIKEKQEMNQYPPATLEDKWFSNPYRIGSRQFDIMQILKDGRPYQVFDLRCCLGSETAENIQRSIRHMRKEFCIEFNREADTYQVVRVVA